MAGPSPLLTAGRQPASGAPGREVARQQMLQRLGDTARSRLLQPMPTDRLAGWLWPLLITLVAGLLRFHRLGTPGKMSFDEIYYADNAHDLLDYGVEYNQKDGTPDFIVHPPVGKWIIAIGEKLLGVSDQLAGHHDALSWRVPLAVLGTCSVLILARAGRRLFRSTLLGCIAAGLMCFDGMHFVESRFALLDLILMFFGLAAFAGLLVDRDATRERLAAYARMGQLDGRFGPGLGLRPWRLLAGVMLGLACATKWSGAFFLVAFAILTVLWDVQARRAAGIARPWPSALARDAVPAFVSLVVVSFVVYVASWAGWFHSDAEHAYNRGWAATHPAHGLAALVPGAVRSLWDYHKQIYAFHTNLHTFHAYRSNPWGWLLLSRPVSIVYEGPKRGQSGCTADNCSEAVTALGNPALWWVSVAALVVLFFAWVAARDWRAGAILCAVAAGYLPWFTYQARTIYSFYAVAFVPYLALAVTYCLGLLLERDQARRRRDHLAVPWGTIVVAAYLVTVVATFWWFYPILSAEVIPYADWYRRMRFPSWI